MNDPKEAVVIAKGYVRNVFEPEGILGVTLEEIDRDDFGNWKVTLAIFRRRRKSELNALTDLLETSPDLNPIEQLFAKLKHLMRKAEQRSHEATWRKLGQLLELVSPTECANYPTNSGYDSVQ